MTELATLIVSDAHLGAVPEAAERSFLAFLDGVPESADELVVAGDLFDFWFEYRSVILREHFPVLRALADLTDRGVRIRMTGGNHDAWIGSFLRDQVGVELLPPESVLELRGRRTYLAHGDGLAGGDWGYRLLKALTRSRLGTAAFRLLHPDLARFVVDRVSDTGERRALGPGALEDRAERLSRHATRLLGADPALDLVVFGHSHRPELREVGDGRFYLNPGDWIHHFTYGVVSREGVELRRFQDA